MSEEIVFTSTKGKLTAKEGKRLVGLKAKNIGARVVKQSNGYFLKYDRRTLDYKMLKDKRIRNVRFFGAVFDKPEFWYWMGLKNSWDTNNPEAVEFLATMWTITKQEKDQSLLDDLTDLMKDLWKDNCHDFDNKWDEVLTGEAEELPDNINLQPEAKAEKLRVTLLVNTKKKFANQHNITVYDDKFVLGPQEDVEGWTAFDDKRKWGGLATIYIDDFEGEYNR